MSTPAEELPIQHGFDLIAFWEEHQSKIVLGAVALLVVLGGYITFQVASTRKVAKAEAALAQASSIEQLQAVVKDHSGTVAAGNAALILGGKLRDAKKYDEALVVLRAFVDQNPKHPMVAGGLLSIGATLEAQGKADQALPIYEEIAAKYTDSYSYSAPFALLAQANIQRSQGKNAEARRSFESIVSTYPDSLLAQQAMQEMKMIKK